MRNNPIFLNSLECCHPATPQEVSLIRLPRVSHPTQPRISKSQTPFSIPLEFQEANKMSNAPINKSIARNAALTIELAEAIPENGDAVTTTHEASVPTIVQVK